MSQPSRRSRLSPERARQLHETVVDLLREVGYEALTLDAVATRAHASKATLYRQWRGKPQLVAAALRATSPVRASHFTDVDTGSLAGDLRETTRRLCRHCNRLGDLLRAVAHAAEREPVLAGAVREAIIEPAVTPLRRRLDLAADRGELAPAHRRAAAFLPQLLLGAVLARPLLDDRPADAAYLATYLDAVVLPALGLDPSA